MEKDELSASNSTKNGMANFNNTDSSLDEANSNNDKDLEVNGGDYSHEFDGNDDSSESDALVIDESVNTRAAKHKRRKIKLKVVKKGKSLNNNSKVAVDSDINNTSGENSDVNNSDSKINNEINSDSNRSEGNVKNDKSNDGALLSDSSVRVNNNVTERESDKEAEPHSNPFFHESLFDLSQKTSSSSSSKKSSTKKQTKRKDGVTQFLGMQPSVQFKCSKCGQNGFESLSLLQQHIDECNESVSVVNRDSTNLNNANGFKLTRKVFLCSACGTYYESWNLYMHMLEFHRRYICLYCLGMFSVLQDLCQHIQNRHNIEPGVKNTPDEFFRTYNEPCYLSCCECSKLFSEQDDFFYHQCSNSGGSKKRSKVAAAVIDPDSHVTGESLITPAANRDVSSEKDDEKANEDKDTEMCTSPQHKESQSQNDSDKTAPPPQSMDASISEDEKSPANQTNTEDTEMVEEEPVETRKVPKLSLKLPKFHQVDEENDNAADDEEANNSPEEDDEEDEEEVAQLNKTEEEVLEKDKIDSNDIEKEDKVEEKVKEIIAGEDVPIIELQLEQPLDKFDIRVLVQKCLLATVPICIYCNHARKIAVNGKQLGLHAMAEHRYSAIVNSITAEELIPESFNNRIKESLEELDKVYFNLESSPTEGAITFSHIFECFPCRYSTPVHKELYLHNRKLHAKNLLLCIMCKSSFYNYSELLCHLCPGQYVLDCDLRFRCCLCVGDDLPSAFRLMVHLRKRHHVCDVCLEMCHDQARLSNHVWKHKLHHFCYRCGIAYRNKPDITRHLFWKHGTESIVCKKCLQKKWPHVYHFCSPPASFTCDECNSSFSKAVYLRVHKRLHSDDENSKKYICSFEGCGEKFISRKLMLKHEIRHNEPEIVQESEKEMEIEQPLEEMNVISSEEAFETPKDDAKAENNAPEESSPAILEEEKPKPKIDVYDLPELNLSESDSSDSETEPVKNTEPIEEKPAAEEPKMDIEDVENEKPEAIENIWDDFKNYQATKEKLDNLFNINENSEGKATTSEEKNEFLVDTSLIDHDYCMDPEKQTTDTSLIEVKPDLTLTERVDHDYCSPKDDKLKEKSLDEDKKDILPEKSDGETRKRSNSVSSSSSSSSSGSSSSCSCGSNCSCTSSSGSSSSSSDSSESDSSTEEGRRKQQVRRRQRFKDKMERKNASKTDKQQQEKNVEESKEIIDVLTNNNNEKAPVEDPIRESDLETTESETDEEFYDKEPQKLAKKILEEKRQQLLAEMGPNLINGGFVENTSRPPTPPNYETEKEVRKKKSKSKKRKKKKNRQRHIPQQPTVAPITLSLKNSPLPTVVSQTINLQTNVNSCSTNDSGNTPTIVMGGASNSKDDSNLRASKRRRVPNKFYGYSSDEEGVSSSERPPPKWRKVEHTPSASPKTVPPITIKTSHLSTPTVAKTPPPTQQAPPSQPTVEPISIRPTSTPGELRVQPRKIVPPLKVIPPRPPPVIPSTATPTPASLNNINAPKPQLYCYCRCPYDEVSEMIGCDSNDCAIEWFHFECVGIMVPPKGQWFCPDCRKKKQQQQFRRD